MGLDIKIPIGLMFTLLGLILTILGLVSMNNTEMYEQSLGYNINLISGLVMLVFGCFMLFTSRLFKKKKTRMVRISPRRVNVSPIGIFISSPILFPL